MIDESRPLLILIPVFNDWVSVARVLSELDALLEGRGASVLLVDDGSTTAPGSEIARLAFSTLHDVDVLRLRRNVGHQRAIAIGLAFVHARMPADAIVIMDGDGEDRPLDVVRLLDALERANRNAVVFAERTRRSEGIGFSTMYVLYRLLHRLLTGERVRVGNFSVIPHRCLDVLVASSDLWNHYAAAVFKARVPCEMVPTIRARRYAGKTKMDYVALVTHGLSAMSVFGERIGVRLLTVTALSALIMLAAIAGVIAAVAAGLTVPVWALFALGLLILMLSQSFAGALTFVFIILAGRDSSTFLPLRDYGYFVADVTALRAHSHDAVPVRR